MQGGERIRLDKWLWYARFLKTRSLAAKFISGASVRIDGVPGAKPATSISPGQVLTFTLAGHVRVIKVLACGVRRGPAAEAQELYEDLAPPQKASKLASTDGSDRPFARAPGAGRPTKRERRKLDQFRDRED